MRTQQPHASQRDVPAGDLPGRDGTAGACFFPARGLCCPDDPLDLVLQLFPAADRAPPPSSLAALGIGSGAAAGGEPPRPVKQEPQSPKPLAESAFVGGGGGWDSWGLSSGFLLEGLCGGLEEIDVDMFFADDALGGAGGEGAEGNLLGDPTAAKPKPAAHITAGGPVVHTRRSLGGAIVPDDASPLPAPMPAGAFPLQPKTNACRAFEFDGPFFNYASPPPPPGTAPMPPGSTPPVVFVTNNSTPPVFVTNNSTPPLPALIMPPAPAPMPPAADACSALPGIASNGAPAPPVPMPAAPALMPAAGLHACGALRGIVSNGAAPAPPPPLMALTMPARALHPNAAALSAGVYSCANAPAHGPPSATPSSSPPSGASSGSGHCPSSTTSEPEFLQPHHASWVVPRKQRSPPAVNRRKRPWLLDFPLHALPAVVAPPPANPGAGGDDDDDAKNRYALVPVVVPPPPPGNTGGNDIAGGGGIRRRRPAPRQRNRQAQRVCSHCHSPETPQWRAGPDGPGTLCNACGIRYAANRLLPEYRPSTAPSFRSGQHSNRHRKVMKLREQQTMNAAEEEEKPSEQAMEDDRREKDDGFMGVCAYISAAGL